MANYIDNTILIAKTKQTQQLERLFREDTKKLNQIFCDKQIFGQDIKHFGQIEIKRDDEELMCIYCQTAWVQPIKQLQYISQKYHTLISIHSNSWDQFRWSQIVIYDGKILEENEGDLPISQQYQFQHYAAQLLKND